MEEAQKPFVCTVEGCSMRFTQEDNLSLHKKKHDMVLNLGNPKTNVFVADQTPTPTRFIRNCEEVGLFQDLQNVNPFEETFRKAVEASRVGGSHLEVQSLQVPAATDDTLHTPHVFPNIVEEHNSITNLIASSSVTETSGEKSDSREELEPLQVPTILHTESTVIEVTDTSDLDAQIEITGLENTEVLVKQETDSSQQTSSRASSVDSGYKIPVTTASTRDTVQVVFRMPNGRFVQLSGVSMDSIPSTQLPIQVPPNVVQTAPVAQSSAASNAVIINTQFVETAARLTQISAESQQNLVELPSVSVPVSSASVTTSSLNITETVSTPQARLSAAKMKLKQRIQINSQKKQTSSSEIEASQAAQKKTAGQLALRLPSSEGSDTSGSANSRSKRSSLNPSSDMDEQKMRFRERNRAAAMRCREKRKHWILELEKRADDTQKMNQQLTAEVTKLRSELVQLKTLLLAHKDCSVTKAMQQGLGIAIGKPSNTVKACSVTEIQVQHSAVSVPQVPVTIPGTLNVCPSPEDPLPKVVLLSKPAGLKRRRQATLPALAVENGTISSKDSQTEQSDTARVVTITQPISVIPSRSQGHQISEDKSSIISNSITTAPPTCLITVGEPTLISTGVPGQSISIKPEALASTSYLMPTKLCLPENNSTLPHIIKLNTNILKTGVTEAMKTNNVSHSNGDSMDSGHGSDIEFLVVFVSVKQYFNIRWKENRQFLLNRTVGKRE
ncbi:Cyclic AMP-dependent transcription factor ATF-2 [Gryllus bimaculatus]|nr:Cyclic AMP-dependent transcription factor ATF-2 [Gryllus bimaculatus]